MKQLYAPWRSDYATNIAHRNSEPGSPEPCVFCTKFKATNDEKNFIIKRAEHNAVLLNLYPYNPGHILVIPYAHVAQLDLLPVDARTELMELITVSSHVLQKTLNAHGINVGLNLGQAAGAGIPTHLHFHVLPRYIGDTNFLPTLADTKQISFDMHKIYEQLREAL